jgi:C4-dicarboxylate transporter DctQ subunit
MKILDHLEEWLVTFLMGGATLIIFVAAVHRYAAGWAIPGVQDWLLSLSLSWAQELTITCKKRKHIKLEPSGTAL